MGCWASREKYEVTREWGGQVGPFFIPEFHSYEILNHQSFFKCVSVGYASLNKGFSNIFFEQYRRGERQMVEKKHFFLGRGKVFKHDTITCITRWIHDMVMCVYFAQCVNVCDTLYMI